MRGNKLHNVVMIADDDLFVRKVIKAALQEFTEFVEVTDGAQVEEVYKKTLPDLLFLDIHLPNQSGLDLIHRLSRFDIGAHIIMLSADSSEENVRSAKLRGSRGFLTKPFDKQRILHHFQRCPTIKFADKP